MAELSGIFNWGLKGYNRLRNKGFKFQQAKSMKKAKKNYRDDNDSVVAFLKDTWKKTKNENDKLPFKYMYQRYRFFCKYEGYKNPLKKKEFKERLKKLGYKIDNSTTDNNKMCIFGVIQVNG